MAGETVVAAAGERAGSIQHGSGPGGLMLSQYHAPDTSSL